MLRRLLLAVLVAPLLLVIPTGCGQSAEEGPKAENSNVKPKGLKTKSGETGGPDAKAVTPTD